ncbi:hypothetical protein GGE46_004840 [Rhizobium etli]|uniref:Uncharacterized protein n=1 Tax=Rhizobium etli TaxID=29449 RepID=A0A7W6ZLC9_RHIET|nr:hypothetical protein [Rhizobium etli]MBB4538056.1 hypothetical protein [Rhizobium etli]
MVRFKIHASPNIHELESLHAPHQADAAEQRQVQEPAGGVLACHDAEDDTMCAFPHEGHCMRRKGLGRVMNGIRSSRRWDYHLED